MVETGHPPPLNNIQPFLVSLARATNSKPVEDDAEPKVVSGYGQYHTDEPGKANRIPYVTIDLAAIREMVDAPPSVEKEKAQWLIPSSLPSRTFALQEKSGEYWMLWADLDSDPKPVDQVASLLQAQLFPGADFEVYTSRSATVERQKCRILVPLHKPLSGAEWMLCQEVLADKLAAVGIEPDRAAERAAQLCYLPNRGDYYTSSSVRDGICFDPLTEWSGDLAEKRRAIESAETESRKARKAAAARRAALSLADAPDTIGAFNRAYSVEEILQRAGYDQRGTHFRHPQSESGSYSASVKDGRVHSLSSADPLYTGGAGGGAHDAFSVFRVLWAAGDQDAALKMAGDEWLSIGGESWNRVKRREYMQNQSEPVAKIAGVAVANWPAPQPLTNKVEPEPYPLDALPLPIRAAVEEVVSFVKAPVPMVASSALAALSLAIQAHADAKRLEKLHGPVGLFILVIADSGERKSTCDGFFTKTISDYEEAQAEAARPALKDHRAAIEAWEAKRGGVKERIRQLAKEQKPTAVMESALRDLEHDRPEPPRIPRLLYADATPEALAYGLAKQWPSGGVVSAEAGIVFGSHGMGKDSVMRNLGLLNQLWDGKSLTIDRRSTESFTVRGARLTVALQVQEPTLREFFTRSGALARGTGFLARFLVAWPESTQGMRQIDPDAPDGPATWPALAAFHRRIAAILEQPVPIDEDGALTPPMLPLTPEAKAAWVEYHNAIEGELLSGGELYDVRDVASKSADNAARLAALFQMFEGAGGAIGAEAFEGASRITAWHLNEARRFFGELALPEGMLNAIRLDQWLIEYCKRERTQLVKKNHALQHGPLRVVAQLDAAICELADLDRLRLDMDVKPITIHLNPTLVEVAR